LRSITVHGLADEVYELLKKRAESEGRSLNRTTKGLLHQALGVEEPVRDHRDDFADLFGAWTEEELRDFERATSDLRRVDPEDWQ